MAPQTHGIQGLPRKSPWQHAAGERVLQMGQPPYEEARGLAAEVAQVATTGMLALATAMEDVFAAWVVASAELGGPTYRSP